MNPPDGISRWRADKFDGNTFWHAEIDGWAVCARRTDILPDGSWYLTLRAHGPNFLSLGVHLPIEACITLAARHWIGVLKGGAV